MGKTKRKWIETDWSRSGCLRAQDIPYDNDSSVKAILDDYESRLPADSTNYIVTETYSISTSDFISDEDYYYYDCVHNWNTTMGPISSIYDNSNNLTILSYNIEKLTNNIARIWFGKSYTSVDIVLLMPGTASNGNSGSLNHIVKDANYTVSANDYLMISDASTSITITCPDSPSTGNTFYILDIADTFNTYEPTVNGNGEDINGSSSPYTMSTDGKEYKIIYTNATYGWKVI